MINVLGIGGIFFRAKDPKALGYWYEETFGINRVTGSYDDPAWTQEGGTTVFAPFPADTAYFEDPDQQWMINFRVVDLDAAVSFLRKAGITVEVGTEREPNGRFARLKDPEGNPIELWQEMPHP